MSGGITIDGQPADPAFGAAPAYEIVNHVSGSPSATGNFRSVWNEEYLYFFVQVFDDDSPVNNSGDPAATFGTWWWCAG